MRHLFGHPTASDDTFAILLFNYLWKWCGRGELNPHEQSPTDFLTLYGFRRNHPRVTLWSGLSLHPSNRLRCCPSSLYTFPFGLGSGLPFKRFPRIWAVLLSGFPRRHSIYKSAAYTIPPRPHTKRVSQHT